MPRRSRKNEQGIYNHITVRGVGRRLLFEDDGDRRRFLFLLKNVSLEESCLIFAWCLMDNHVHLLVQAEAESISKMMQRICSAYSHWFNGKHGHVGHVFQGRYGSTPVMTDEHFLAAIKYIHMNPHDMGIVRPQDYPWSSYQEYLGRKGICRLDVVLEMLGGTDAFVAFHDCSKEDVACVSLAHRRISDVEANVIAKRLCGIRYRDTLASLAASERNASLAHLKMAGLSIRQIERLTGIGRGIIANASL